MSVKSWLRGRMRSFLCLGLLFLAGQSEADTRRIRLRNEIIETAPASQAALHSVRPAAPVSGLYLVQFKEPLRPEWRAQLAALNVRLLRPVPDDAFVARLQAVDLSLLRALPFVQWADEYRADYKVHGSLPLPQRNVTNAPAQVAVNLLLTPDIDRIGAARILQNARGLKLKSVSRFGAILQAVATREQLAALAALDSVLWIEPMPRMTLFDEISSKIVAGGDVPDPPDPGEGEEEFEFFSLNAPPSGAHTNHATITQQLGFDGRGVVVAVADSGLHNGDAETMHPDLAGRVDAFFHYGELEDAADEHSHGTHVAGIIAGNGAIGETDDAGTLYGLGVAPGAHLVAQRIFDGIGNYMLVDNDFERLVGDAMRAGAIIGSNSWGDDTQGRYDVSAAEFDALVRDGDVQTPGDQPYILEFSAGNAGPGTQTIGSPAVAKNVIASGASQNNRFDFFIYAEGQETMADFSSRGPCEDGRIKPDVVAPGTWIASLQSESSGDENAWSPISFYYQYQGGTSQSGPHVSGAAAVFVQYYRETHNNATPSPAMVKAALINSAVDMDSEFEAGPVPNNDEGWGRIDLTEIMASDRRFDFVDQSQPLQTGQVYERRLIVGSPDLPLKVTLTYTDVPGFPAAIPALVNDLDLEVVGPNGEIYRGNQFFEGESVPNVPAGDNINNVEAVHLAEPSIGEYLVRVRARNVAEDARRDTGPIDQDFALVSSGDLPEPTQGIIYLDRPAYTAPSQAQIRLIDFDLSDQPSAQVTVSSETEPAGEIVTLQTATAPGIFGGTIPTVNSATPAVDGRLQLSHGDTISVTYLDASSGETRRAEAVADFQGPVLSGVSVTNRLGRMIVSWATDEPANAIVRYGTNRNLTLSATNSTAAEFHEVALSQLAEGATYFFEVISDDLAGNRGGNDNNGQLFSFVPVPAPVVLFVNAAMGDLVTADVPITEYTEALDRTGITYDVWDITQGAPSPALEDLRPFRVVIWRFTENWALPMGLSPGQQTVLTNYLAGGGSLLISSMEILSALGPVAFRTNALQVQEYKPARVNEFEFSCDGCDQNRGVASASGVAGDPISGGLSLSLDYEMFHTDIHEVLGISPDFADTFTPTTNAAPIFIDDASGKVAGIRYPRTGQDSSGRVVLLTFPLEAVPLEGEAPNNRVNLLRNILGFLAPGSTGSGGVAVDKPAYSVPGRVTIEVTDADLAGQGGVSVRCFTSSAPQPQSVVLSETVRRGLFRGFVSLGPVGAAAAPGQVAAKDGDTISIEYLDASASSLLRAEAEVDTVRPEIAGIEIEPEYEEAIIRWETSEPADALVQFGESPFFNRTAYTFELAEEHELILNGLQADRLYYYQVVSRDGAGNTTVDDNNGRFYTFRTLKPLSAPWADTFATRDTDWVVLDGDLGGSSWTLGTPSNEFVDQAFSPPFAWASNLAGDAIDGAETQLVSPAISLVGGNSAMLRFRHFYDFSELSEFDIMEVGQVHISVNNGQDWAMLKEYGEWSDGWEQEEISLTPYVGKVVRLAFFYVFFSLEPNPRPGWLIDDVSISLTNILKGTLQVSNNLAQASFTINGPASRTGEGSLLTIPDAVPGAYVVTFNDVPYYLTPAAQTNEVTANATTVFRGVYTFPDTNTNGISDLWEQEKLGAVSPSHPASADTDGDGMNDYCEFAAGTSPTDANSRLNFTSAAYAPNGAISMRWRSVPGRAYRILSSPDMQEWTVQSPWIRASFSETGHTFNGAGGSSLLFFRLEARP